MHNRQRGVSIGLKKLPCLYQMAPSKALSTASTKASLLLKAASEMEALEREAHQRHADMAISYVESVCATTSEVYYSIPDGSVFDIPGMDMHKCQEAIKTILESNGFFVRRLKDPHMLWISWNPKHTEQVLRSQEPVEERPPSSMDRDSKARKNSREGTTIICDPSTPLGGLHLRASLISHANGTAAKRNHRGRS